ncbi:Aa-trans domain-containing protein [Fusarium keratoplasticum]|uniref:Aa-trans domain-containing protein n=1 Tax=Fusarium keratoplasticum TaxID=1328300 RepID=A0ACC0R487_9HYPO|nr:Aa-trans domain-containing protein [Fusarium keratoplasticum]KAI8674457.1 Aa-trans domain-containing protein [Fusarium keratoplasticum]KAI8680976.1 Aa-trans domain-containing protein [Fusarium keratoplasticum]
MEPKSSKLMDQNRLTAEPSNVEDGDNTCHPYDAVFGEITEDGPNYRNVGWIGTSALMIKAQIGLGVLSIPQAFDVLGIVPGVITLSAVAGITTWSDYIVGVFKLRHPEIYGIDDVGAMLFGRVGREILAAGFVLYYTFVAGSMMLGISIGLNAVSMHGTCTAVFVAVAAMVGGSFASIRTLGRMSWLALVGVTSLVIAIVMVTIAVGVQDRPAAAPKEGPFKSDFKVVGNPSFADAVSAISTFVFAYAGTPAFFSFAAEMREPKHYVRALTLCQIIVTVAYVGIGCVVYYFCGSYVASPALGSAGSLIKKISYGIAIPGIVATAMLTIHLPGKYLFVRFLRGTKHLTANTFVHWGTWLGCVFGVTITAYIIASAIPVFGGLVSFIGALLGTLMSFQPMGCMWLYDNWSPDKRKRNLRWFLMVIWSGFVVVSGTFLMVAGTYGSVVTIIDSYKKDGGSKAWACADNSNSV